MSQFNKNKLEYDTVYHIYNCGIDGSNLFITNDDYDHFLSKYSIYIEPIAETFAWCLLGNHFHLVVRIKKESEIKTLEELNLFGVKTKIRTEGKKPNPTNQFSHLFNSYAQHFNNKYKRHGTLFERSFHKKLINNRSYFKRCLIYVHQNPIKHGFVENLSEYRYTSYNTILSDKVTLLKREKVMTLFENQSDFSESHILLVSLDESFD
jgi:REP element-mobilizing transposase RayT